MAKKSLQSHKRGDKSLVDAPTAIEIDAFRSLVFPNHIRTYRKQLNMGSLLELSDKVPSITYIRLSKIERGEIFARADEIIKISQSLEVKPLDLLIDIDDPDFDIAAWAEPLYGSDRINPEIERFSVYLAAAMRVRRTSDDRLTIATLEQEYGIAPVILSRIENALKPLNRWNDDVRTSLRRLFQVKTDVALIDCVNAMLSRGELDMILPLIANPQMRIAKSRKRIAALRTELGHTASVKRRKAAPVIINNVQQKTAVPISVVGGDLDGTSKKVPLSTPSQAMAQTPDPASMATITTSDAVLRWLPVFGTPLADGLIAKTPLNLRIEAPSKAGPCAYGLRMCRPTLGAALPGKSTLIVDPDLFPSAGGLAVIASKEGLRVLSVTFDRHGQMLGYSQNPDLELVIDDMDPANIATVVAAIFE